MLALARSGIARAGRAAARRRSGSAERWRGASPAAGWSSPRHNPRQGRRDRASCCAPFGVETCRRRRARPARAGGDRHDASRPMPTLKALAAATRAAACRRWPTIPGLVRAGARRRARHLFGALGRPDARRDFGMRAWQRVEQRSLPAHRRPRARHLPSRAGARLAGRPCRDCSTAGRRPPRSGRRAASAASATIRCFHAERRDADLRRDGRRPRRHAISHRGRAFAKLRRGLLRRCLTIEHADPARASTSIGRSASRNAPIATSTAMSATASSRRAGARRCWPSSTTAAATDAGPAGRPRSSSAAARPR